MSVCNRVYVPECLCVCVCVCACVRACVRSRARSRLCVNRCRDAGLCRICCHLSAPFGHKSPHCYGLCLMRQLKAVSSVKVSASLSPSFQTIRKPMGLYFVKTSNTRLQPSKCSPTQPLLKQRVVLNRTASQASNTSVALRKQC